ncbi:MAG: hypothetical protein U0939_09135 [Pirellulales bacterium]
MRSLQSIAAWLALGATLVASLGSHALHGLAPHGADCHEPRFAQVPAADDSFGGVCWPSDARCACGHSTRGATGVDEACVDESQVDASSAGRTDGSLAAAVGGAGDDDHDCAICRHLSSASEVARLVIADLRPQVVSRLSELYYAPLAACVFVGWYSRGPPASA